MNENFAAALRDLMDDKNVNAELLAKKLNVSPSTVRRWTYAETDIKLSSLLDVVGYFGCSLDYITGNSAEYLDYTPEECPVFMTWLPTVIKACGKTSYAIFKNTKIKSAHFYQWRNGGEPKLSTLSVLANYLDCSLDYLVGRKQSD